MSSATNANLKTRTNQKVQQKSIQKQPEKATIQKLESKEEEKQLQALKEQQQQGDSQVVNSFWTCDELLQCLPQVLQLRKIFQLYVQDTSNVIDVLKVSECLHAMGLRCSGVTLNGCLAERLLQFPPDHKPPNRVSFELVLTLYSQLAEELPIVSSVLINGLRSCDGQSAGVMPLVKLRRLLVAMGRRLIESEICALLDALQDDKGNVNYVRLLESIFAVDLQAVNKLQEVRLYLDAVGKNASHMDMRKRDEFIATLRNLDASGSGYIAAERLLQLLNANGDRFTIAELATLTRGMTNCKKQVDYRLFLRLIMNE
ncbi:uncharacterized protein LOC132796889 [Drosophila nasuta]|uniref:uncharacterized protein LOC132796889 n=1 Tax=Drosophila nasuta TaxID=42062 RepID=UPI00295EE4E5|nr:uncharacterized protein LOC132796889 [Drosophila nasuta]